MKRGGNCEEARMGADVPENLKSTLNDVERNIQGVFLTVPPHF